MADTVELRIWKIDVNAIIPGLLVLFLVYTILFMLENYFLMDMFLQMRLASGAGGFVEGIQDAEVAFIFLLKLFFIFLAFGAGSIVAAMSVKTEVVLHTLVMGIAGALMMSISLLFLNGVEDAGSLLDTYYLVEKLWGVIVCVAVGSMMKLRRRRRGRELAG